MLTLIRNTILGVFAFAFGVGLGASDYLYQRYQAGGQYSLDDYEQLQIERFDGTGGKLGLMFRKSSRVTQYLPPAPPGWDAQQWSSVPYSDLYSAQQMLARKRHLVSAVPDLTFMEGMGSDEEALLDVYLDDVSRVYTRGDRKALIDLRVDVPGLEVGSEAWRRYLREVRAYYDHMDDAHIFATISGLTWTEHVGPVERATNQSLKHALRKFEADLGPIHLRIKTRAAEEDILDFLMGLDLTALAQLAAVSPPREPLPKRSIPPFLDSFPRDANGAVLASLEDCGSDRPRIPKVVFCY